VLGSLPPHRHCGRGEAIQTVSAAVQDAGRNELKPCPFPRDEREGETKSGLQIALLKRLLKNRNAVEVREKACSAVSSGDTNGSEARAHASGLDTGKIQEAVDEP
jgi:hypothetical protein